MKRMAWFEIAGLLATGGVAAYFFNKHHRSPQTGDIVGVPPAALTLQLPNQAASIDLKAFAPTGVVSVKVADASHVHGMTGNIDTSGSILPGVLIPVQFDGDRVMTILRNGKMVV
jgi:hypothetical protein